MSAQNRRAEHIHSAKQVWGSIDERVLSAKAWPVLLYGPVGTSKTSRTILYASRLKIEREKFQCTNDSYDAELLALPTIRGVRPQAGVRCLQGGKMLVLDDVHELQGSALGALYLLCDDPHLIQFKTLDGADVEAHPNYRVILTSNQRPDNLPLPVKDRVIPIWTPMPCPEAIRAAYTKAHTAEKKALVECVVEGYRAFVEKGPTTIKGGEWEVLVSFRDALKVLDLAEDTNNGDVRTVLANVVPGLDRSSHPFWEAFEVALIGVKESAA